MMKLANTKLQETWKELEDIFGDFHKLTSKHISRLEKLGFKVVYMGGHPKLYIEHNGTVHVVTFSSTPSDRYAGRQILRQIRRIYDGA